MVRKVSCYCQTINDRRLTIDDMRSTIDEIRLTIDEIRLTIYEHIIIIFTTLLRGGICVYFLLYEEWLVLDGDVGIFA